MAPWWLADPEDMEIIHHVAELANTIVGLVFLWAGAAKLASRESFRTTLWHLPHLPTFLAPSLEWLVPVSEIAIGYGLIIGLIAAKIGALALLMCFCLFAIIVIRAKLKVPCNCFGAGNRSFSTSTIIQNIGLAALVCIGFRIQYFDQIAINVFSALIGIIAFLSCVQVWSNYRAIVALRKLKILR